jgi:transposase
MNIKRIGLDLAKNIFQIHAVDHHEHVVLRKTLRRDRMIAFFSQLSPCLIGIEACGSSHYWARELTRMGIRYALSRRSGLSPILKARRMTPTMRKLSVRLSAAPECASWLSKRQQTLQAEHRVRARLIRARTALSNEIRGLLGEFGLILPWG